MSEHLTATLATNRGDIVITLFPDHAPKTVRNFVELAEGTKEFKDAEHRHDGRRRPAVLRRD